MAVGADGRCAHVRYYTQCKPAARLTGREGGGERDGEMRAGEGRESRELDDCGGVRGGERQCDGAEGWTTQRVNYL